MSAITSPVTGSPSTGLTSPSYTLVRDYNADSNVEAYYVSVASGGGGVDVHNINHPFQVSFYIPKTLKYVSSAVMLASGLLNTVTRNTYGVTVRKGVLVNGVGGRAIAYAKATIDIPVNSEVNSELDIRNMLSLLGGVLQNNGDHFVAAIQTGTMP